MEEGKVFFNKTYIPARIFQWIIFLAGVGLLFAYFTNIIPEFPKELQLFNLGPLVFGACLFIAGTLFLLGPPMTADDCVYKQYRYLKKEELAVYYDMGHKIWIAFENQGIQCTNNLEKIRALDKFRVAYYYKKKDGEPILRQFEIL